MQEHQTLQQAAVDKYLELIYKPVDRILADCNKHPITNESISEQSRVDFLEGWDACRTAFASMMKQSLIDCGQATA